MEKEFFPSLDCNLVSVSTVALGPLPIAVNCADTSPDGRWMAVASDSLDVLLLPEALDYCHLAAMRLQMRFRYLSRCLAEEEQDDDMCGSSR